MRLILMGNAGAGKSSMARRLIGEEDVPRLCLDEIAWNAGAERKPLEDSLTELHRFLGRHEHWVVEGCYGDLIEAALPYCTELRFLNPGEEACVEHCKRRPWEPEKFPTPDAQQAMLGPLISWVREYRTRGDEYGLARHRSIFDGFTGPKKEYTTLASYDEG